MILYDHTCPNCGAVFEAFRQSSDSQEKVECTVCHTTDFALKHIGTPRIDPRLGTDASGFPSMGAKWVKRRKQHQRMEERRNREHGD